MGLTQGRSAERKRSLKARPGRETWADTQDIERRKCFAIDVWSKTCHGRGTLVATYLASRGIELDVPGRLRFDPRLKHCSGVRGPAMIALITSGLDDQPMGIHRTWLCEDGNGKAILKPNRMMLGTSKGGAVRLSEFDQPLLVGEGIETTLSAMQVTGHSGWAALSASGLRSLELTPDAKDIIILADGDAAGETAAVAAARRWQREGRRTRIARSPSGMDFNDLLLAVDETIKDIPE